MGDVCGISWLRESEAKDAEKRLRMTILPSLGHRRRSIKLVESGEKLYSTQ